MTNGRVGTLLLVGLAAGCATQLSKGPPPQAAPVSAPASAPHDKHVIAERPAPPRVTAPMKGEPTGAALADARLVETTCATMTTDESAGRITAMRAEVDASFKEWHDEQPDCWAADRAAAAQRQADEVAWAAGGLGLSGIGEGGGGRGEGIGLGSVGTIGRGAGAASGQGYGRFSGTHASSSEQRPGKAARASTTNNQVAAVDEADIVKTDGSYVYFAANGALRIAEALDPKIVSVTKLPGATRELFVEGDRAVVYTSSSGHASGCTYGYDCQFAGDGSTTSIIVLDIKDRKAPRVVRTLELSGSLMAARRIGHAVHTVVADNDRGGQPEYATWPQNMPTCGIAEAAVRTRFAQLKTQNEAKIRARFSEFPSIRDGKTKKAMCDGVMRTAIRDGEAFTSVVSFDLSDDSAAPTTATIQSRPGAVFASADSLYLSVVHHHAGNSRWYSSVAYSSTDEVSEIHRFAIGDKAKTTKYSGSGIVPGHVLNQFSMDEWSGYLRVATTRGRVPEPGVQSAVSILTTAADGNLTRVGAVTGIAPGEDIRAVRFDGDRGYVVTFKKTDPLFVLDLYQANSPGILGELKIPGFSTYIHRIDPEHLLSIGFDADDHGDFAFFDGVILQLFDVKNATEPRLLHKEKIGSRGSSSEAATDHLAFNYFPEAGLLAVPMTECVGGGDGTFASTVAFSGLLVYNVDVEAGFTRLGGVDHSGKHDVSCQTWWSNAHSTVKRSVFLDDLVYSVAEDRVKVQRLGHLGTDVADLSLGGDF